MSNKTSQKQNVPQLRFPEFRDEWKEMQLGKLSIILRGGSPRPIDSYLTSEANGLNWLKIGDVDKESKYIVETKERVKKSALKKTRVVNPGDLIMSNSMSFGRPYILKIESCIHDGWIAITEIQECIKSIFLFYFILSDSSQLYFLNAAAGGGIKNLNADIVKLLPVSFPEKNEQQKIADCLSSLDELIDAEAQKLGSLKDHKKGLMQQLFPAEGKTTPNLRFPEFQDAPEWLSTTIGGLVNSEYLFPPKDGNHGNIHPKSSDFVEKGIPFIMASDLRYGNVDTKKCHFISKEQADNLQKGFSKEGDVLLSHKGTVGEVAIVKKINTPYLMLTPQVTYYRVKNSKKLSNKFLEKLFVSDVFQTELNIVSGGGTRAYIGITEQSKLRITLPHDVNEQLKIADCLNALDNQITAQTEKIETLKQHKRGLMQQLFPSLEEAER